MRKACLIVYSAAAVAFAGVPVGSAAKPADQSGHPAHHRGHAASASAESEQAKAVLVAYRTALVERDAAAMHALFHEDSLVFENGKAEGSFAHYMEHHLGPELGKFTEFAFINPTVEVRTAGHVAFGHETFGYTIALKDGRVIEREGVATSVLTHGDDGWKIVQYHSSSRAPRGN